ncbi:MAG: carotenoid biosynthesis protein [Cytophagales bacterium]
MKNSTVKYSIGIIIILHLVALAAFFLGYSRYILPLTPVNLLITAYLIYLNQQEKSNSFIINSILIVLVAYIVEVIGVNTGLFFGNYEYMDSLGPKIWDTPPIIGINWWILTIAAASFFRKSQFPLVLKAFLSTVLMLFIDLWIEPISDLLKFWQWENNIIPLKNYLGWFITGFALQIIYWQGTYNKKNKIGIPVYIILISFFLILNLFLR